MDLFGAAEKGNLERVRFLLEQGAVKDEVDIHGVTPLYHASINGHIEVVQYLVEQGASLDKADGNLAFTPLSGAACSDYLEVTRYLLEQGADRDKADSGGMTSLHWAAREGHLETAMLLMSYGADLNARTNDGLLPIDMGWEINEEIKQAIRDEPRRRMDHGHKRATEQDRHLSAATSAAAQQEDEKQGEQEVRSNKRPRLDKGAVVTEEKTKVAEEVEDSEPSDEEVDN